MAQARLNGTIIDDGGAGCEARFQYGMTIAMGLFTPWQGSSLLVTGDTFSSVLTGLRGNTIYFFQAEVRNAVGVGTSGAMLSFMTIKAIGPIVEIQVPTGVTASAATLHGAVTNEGDRPGQVRFQYGASASYGMVTAWQDGFGTGNSFNATIQGLSPGSAYHCRAEFQNGRGPSVVSGDLTFSTLSETGGMVLVGDDILAILGGA